MAIVWKNDIVVAAAADRDRLFRRKINDVRAGIDVVKFFPADRLGGLDTIRALAAPFVGVQFVPSGGVTAESAIQYLADPAVPAVSGSWMASRSTIALRDWERVTLESAETVAAL